MSTAHVVDLGDFSDHPLVAEFSESFCVTGASRVSGDLAGAVASVRRTAMLLAAFDATNSPEIYVDDRAFDGRDSTNLDYTGKDALDIEGGLGQLRISTKGMPLGDGHRRQGDAVGHVANGIDGGNGCP